MSLVHNFRPWAEGGNVGASVLLVRSRFESFGINKNAGVRCTGGSLVPYIGTKKRGVNFFTPLFYSKVCKP